MKHSLALFALISIVAALPFTAQAQSCTSAAPFCDNPNYVCQIEPGASMGFCTPPSAVDDGPGTGEVGNCGGLACSSTEVCCAANGQQFCATQSQCDAQEGGGVTIPNTPATQSVQAQEGDVREFVPLTSVPGLQEAGRSNNFAGLLNNLYLIAVGAGAALAVLQIVRGGLTYMLSDSVTNKKEAREVITGAVLGLLLVLSPAIVFGLIDPRILNLNVNFGPLAPADADPSTGDGAGDPDNRQDAQSNNQDNDSDGGISDDSDSTGQGGGSVPLRICAATGTYVGVSHSQVRQFCTSGMASQPMCEGKPTITDARALECNQNYPVTGDDCLASLVSCTQISASLEATSQSSCRAQFASGAGSTILWNCPQMSSNVALDASVPGPLCAGSQGYALNSNNLDCPF